MADAIAKFFEALDERGYEPLLHRGTGTLRFDLGHDGRTETWFVAVDKGNVSVSHRKGTADCILRTDRALFARIAAGRANVMAAVLRGLIAIEGDIELLMLFQRLFPGPSGRRTPVPAAGAGKGRA